MRPKGTGRMKRRKKERAKGKRKREKAERMIKSKPKEDERRTERGWKEDERRTHLCERQRKIATRLPQNYTFVFNSKDVWRKRASLTAFT